MRRIAVIGSGVSGLGAAWSLSQEYEVTVFEGAATAGGHAHTVDVGDGMDKRSVDTGFLVYNDWNYPHLIRLFEHLDVPTIPSNMSFAVSMDEGRLEYTGSAAGLFAQKSNILRPRFWSMIRDILRFFDHAPQWLAASALPGVSLGRFLSDHGYGQAFIDDHLVPMAAAIWSCPDSEVLDFPAANFLGFLHNHGLLRLKERPQWRTVHGGSRTYVNAITGQLGDRLHLNTPVRKVVRGPNGVEVMTDADHAHFDAVVFATHADQALRILGPDASAEERRILGAFRYSHNETWLHSDPDLMPKRRRCWSSWNYMGQRGASDSRTRDVSVTYWLNRLQDISGGDLFVSLNPLHNPTPDRVHKTMTYEHPIFDQAAGAAQPRLGELQGVQHTWFCGSYFGYGFHEDGLESGFAVAHALGAPVPWHDEVQPASPAAGNAQPTGPRMVEQEAA